MEAFGLKELEAPDKDIRRTWWAGGSMSGEPGESLVAGLFKSLVVGAGVAIVGLVVCALTLPILLCLRELGLLASLLLLPVASFFAWRATGRYLAAEPPNRHRVAFALASRYFVVGAALGILAKFLMGGSISDTAFIICLGSAIGTVGGGLGGAFQGWIQSRGTLNISNRESSYIDQDFPETQTIDDAGNPETQNPYQPPRSKPERRGE